MHTHIEAKVVAHTVPYPWPYDRALDPAHTALVICGAQHGLADASVGSTEVIGRLTQLARVVRAQGGLVMWIRHGARPAPSPGRRGLLAWRGTASWDLVEAPDDADLVIDASGWDGSFGSDLDHTLRSLDVRTILLGGFASEITVDSTVRTLNDRGHECLVLTDGCAPADSDLGARAHASLTMSGGIFGALGTTIHVIAALTACTPEEQP
ncbi:MAG: isochorismatase family protein [Ilumatobacteraceae bacterium]|nr:isochorismatase family protein [Ilumatobacteraceae bacterium]